jgi:hypothetical protein
MRRTWIVLFFLGLGVMTWVLASRKQEPQLVCQEPIDPQAMSGEYDPSEAVAVFENRSVRMPEERDDTALARAVLGSSSAPKRIEVDLSSQRLYAFEGDRKVYEFLISSGKPWWATPTGSFRIWIKLRYAKMEGGSKDLGTYYYLPNVCGPRILPSCIIGRDRISEGRIAFWQAMTT